MARLRSVTATSAGGIVVRVGDGGPEIVVGMRRREHGVTWTLPKGTPESGETVEQTAVREVGEESGLDVEIVERLPSIEYSFVQHGTRINKTVHYFLMDPIGGDLDRHDHEFADVRWMPFGDAQRLLSFETERGLVGRAEVVVGERLASAAERSGRVAPSEAGA